MNFTHTFLTSIREKELPPVSVVQHNLSSYEQLLRGKGGLQ